MSCFYEVCIPFPFFINLKDMKWRSEVKSLSRVRLFATPRTVAYQDPQSMGFSRQEYWSGLQFPSPKDMKGCIKFILQLKSSQE